TQGATFSHTFNSAGTFPYYCTPHGGCCGMVGTVIVANASPTPAPTPSPSSTPMPTPTPTPTLNGCFPNFTTAGGCDALSFLTQGATFSHTFNSAGTFPYYCTPHGGCCGMVGTVIVANASPTPAPTPSPSSTPMPTPTPTPTLNGCFPNFTTAGGCDALSFLT